MSIQNKVYKWPSCSPRVPEGRAGELRLTAASCDWNTTTCSRCSSSCCFCCLCYSGGFRGGSFGSDDPTPNLRACIKPPTIMLSWRILFCFLPDYITVVAYNLQNIASFWRTCPPDLLAGLLPLDPNEGLSSRDSLMNLLASQILDVLMCYFVPVYSMTLLEGRLQWHTIQEYKSSKILLRQKRS